MTAVRSVRFDPAPAGDRPLLVLGPSLGTSVRTLWRDVATALAPDFVVLGWELPGHGATGSTDQPDETGTDAPLRIVDLANAVVELIDREYPERSGQSCYLAGDSVGAAVALQLCLDHPDRVAAALLCCTAPRIGEPAGWHDRAALVRRDGVAPLLAGTPARWFGAGFSERRPDLAKQLLAELASVDPAGYAAVCDALAEFDLRARLPEIDTPLIAVAGEQDQVCPPARARHLADGVVRGQAVVLPGVGHLAPAEASDAVVELIRQLPALARDSAGGPTVASLQAEGMRVRREVLGDAHVDRASARVDDFTRDFQSFITRYAWGTVWTREGLDRRSRSLITLTALVARGHHDELAMHVRAARRNGLTRAELAELFLQTAIYCGVPDANAAFRIAQQVLDEEEGEP